MGNEFSFDLLMWQNRVPVHRLLTVSYACGARVGIAVDWLTGNVYWTDAQLGHIMVSRLDGRYHKILLADVGRPKGIAVDPVAR